MSTLRQILQMAMAGAQAPLPPALSALAADWGEADAPAAQLLQASILLTQAERCARPLPRHGGPALNPAPPDTLPAAHADLAEVLRQALREAQPNAWVIDDAASVLVRRREHLPHLLLPVWFAFVATRPLDHQAPLMVCTGERGAWLAVLNPEWSGLRGVEPDESIWETGRLVERVAWLSARRSTSPDAGRAALEAIWSQAPPEEREKFLPCLLIGLSMQDEPFLDAARSDKRKDVRRVALMLLAQLPESALVHRMLARLKSWLVHTPGGLLRGARLEVRLPAEYDKNWALDGIPEKTTRQHEQIGDKANWLAEALGFVPLARLLQDLQVPVAAWTKLIDSHEFSAALWTGSVNSFDRHPVATLLPALSTTTRSELRAILLRASLREAHRAADLSPWLEPWTDGAIDLSLALPLMPALDLRWSKVLLRQVRAYIDKHRGHAGYWAELLPRCSERLHPALLDEWIGFLDPLGNEPYAGKAWANAIAFATARHKLHSFLPRTDRP